MNENFATSRENIFLSLTSATIEDTAGNPIETINTSFPLQVDMFDADRTQPQLESFSFDSNSGI